MRLTDRARVLIIAALLLMAGAVETRAQADPLPSVPTLTTTGISGGNFVDSTLLDTTQVERG